MYLRNGDVVAFPTETVYGLGADAFNPDAVKKIFAAKGRPADNPLIVHIAAFDQLDQLAATISGQARLLIEHFFPGPLTIIVKKQPGVPDLVTGGLDTVGIRMPRHAIAHAFLQPCGVPVAAPSANLSGRPSPTTWKDVAEDLDGRIACILRGDRSEAGLESTVVDCTASDPVVLRTGVVTLEHLRTVLPTVYLAPPHEPRVARSPGTRYRHYAPHAHVRLVAAPSDARPDPGAAYIGLDRPDLPHAFGLVFTCKDVAEYAYEVFAFFRRCDAIGLKTIYCQTLPPVGLGHALMDRLHRAAQR